MIRKIVMPLFFSPIQKHLVSRLSGASSRLTTDELALSFNRYGRYHN